MKKIVVCTDLNHDNYKRFKFFQNHQNEYRETSFELLFIFERSYHNDKFSEYSWPSAETEEIIKDKALKELAEIRDEVFAPEQNVTLHCVFADTIKTGIVDYAKKTNPDFLAIATRGKHGIEGLFTSSIADYLNKFSPVNIMVLR